MNTADDRLVWAVKFAQLTSLQQLSSGEWEELRAGLTHFLNRDPGRIREEKQAPWAVVARSTEQHAADKLTEAEWDDLHRSVKDLLIKVLEKERTTSGVSVSGTPSITITAKYSLWFPGHARFLFVEGPIQDMVLFVLHLLLVRGGAEQLRHCPACNTVFVRVHKQQYCSRRCTKRAAMQAWRQTPKGKAAQARTSRRQYERKTQQQPGKKNVKVGTYQKRESQQQQKED